MIEAEKVKPNRLQDILFTGTGKKGDNYKFGPVVGRVGVPPGGGRGPLADRRPGRREV